jgi:PPK2 family polyphosphate:nucleotide phosphotransferase
VRASYSHRHRAPSRIATRTAEGKIRPVKAKLSKKVRDLVGRYRVDDPHGFRLKDSDPAETAGLSFEGKSRKAVAEAMLQDGVARLATLQNRLYAQDRWGVLVILQAMDAAGKDSTIKHVMSGVNPQGVEISAFKVPTPDEIDHDYLWRAARRLPERGRIGIFNRSYYEEVLVVRVHPEILKTQKIPPSLVGEKIWPRRYDDINAFERHLTRNGFRILKFFLHVSKKEQRRRFLERLDDPEKNWKFSLADVKERKAWDAYQKAYQDAIRATSTDWAPWFVVPADHKWFTRLVVAAAIVDELERLELRYPELDAARRRELLAARRELER